MVNAVRTVILETLEYAAHLRIEDMRAGLWAGADGIWLLFGAQMPLCYRALQNQLKRAASDSLCVVISVLRALF